MADKVVSLKVVVDTATGTANVENLNEELRGTVEATEQTGKQSKKVTTDMSNGFKMVGDAIGRANPMLGQLISGINMATKASFSFISTPLGIVLAAIAAAGLLVYQAFKTFQPLLDKIEQGFAAISGVIGVVRNAFVAMVTGSKSVGEAFRGLGGDMSEAAKRASELKKAQQELNNEMKIQEVSTAKSRALINSLNVAAKDRTKSEKERIELLRQASILEELDYNERKKIADKELKQAKEAIIIKAGLKGKELEDFEELGVAYQQYSEKKGGAQDELYLNLKNAILKGIELEDEATTNLEKNVIKRNQLLDDEKAKRDKVNADLLAAAKEKEEKEKEWFETIKQINEDLQQEFKKGAEESEKHMDEIFARQKQLTEQRLKLQKEADEIIIELGEIEETGEFEAQKRRENELAYDLKVRQDHADKLVEIARKKQENLQFYEDLTMQGLGIISSMNEVFANKSEENAKKAFENNKKIQIAEALVSTYFAAQKAYASQIIPLDPTSIVRAQIAAGVAIVSGLSRVAKIKSMKYDSASSSMDSSGGVSGLSGGTQSQSTGLTVLTPQSVRSRKDAEPVKVYVTETDIRAASGRVSDIQSKAVVK
jgi:hypothetical protein